MKIESKEALLLVLVCLLCIISTSNSVAPRRPSRFDASGRSLVNPRSRYQSRSSWLAKARMVNPVQTQELIPGEDGTMLMRPAKRTRVSKFRPSITRCCKVGEKAAKKEMTCNLDEHITKKSGNLLHKAKLGVFSQQSQQEQQVPLQAQSAVSNSRAAKELLNRISKCAASKFAPNLEKCCKYRQQFMNELAGCSKQYRGAEKRKCRQTVRRRYP